MASVFLSYDRDDGDKARTIALALEKSGHSVWWDLHVRGGAQFSKVIEEALKAADAVVVLWSAHSVESAWVRDEAAAGRDSGRLVPATIDGTEAPLGFRQFQTIDLRDWKRGARSRGYKELGQAIAETAVEPALTSPEGASGSRDREVTRIGRKRDGRQRLWISLLAVVLLAAAGAAAWQFSGGSSSVPVVAVAAAERSPRAEALARVLLFKLGSLRATKTDAVRLIATAGDSPGHADFIFEAAGTSVALLSGKYRAVLWSKDFNGVTTNQTALEQSMAYTAGQVLDCALQASAPSQERLNEQTLKLFLNGCALFAERYRSDSLSVVPIFSQIVASAPWFQPAWSKLLLAEAQALRGQMMFYDRYVPGSLPEHIRQARKLNRRMPEIYVAEAALLPITAFDQRFRLLGEAEKLSPDDPDLRVVRSELLASIGRNDDAVEDARRAVEINPLSPGFRSHFITTLTYAGELSAAEEELSRAERLWLGSPTIEDARFRLHSRYGDARDALRMIQSPDFRQPYPTQDMEKYLLARINPTPANIDSAIATARSGHTAKGRKLSQISQLLADFGRNDELYTMLMSLSPDWLRFVSQSFYRSNFRKFRQDPRFMQVESRAGLIEFWRKSGEWPDFCSEQDLPYDCKKEAAKYT